MRRYLHKILSKRRVLYVLFLMVYLNSFSQHLLIPTGTSTHIREVRKKENTIVLNGNYNYFAKCNGDCDQITILQPAGPINYLNRHLNILDTNRFYVSSFMGSIPYHAIISKSIDGGQNWTTILDTLSEDFFTKGLLVFDTNRLILPVSLYRTFITNNGGNTWQAGSQHNLLTLSSSLKVNDSISVLGIGSHLMTTTDKGESWVHSGFISADPISYFSCSLDSLYAVSSGMDGVYFSFRFGFGNSWVNRLIPLFAPTGLYVVSKNEVYITGKGWPQEYGRIMKTSDLGNTWSYYDIPETETLYEMVFLNDSTALIGGNNGALVKWNKNSPMTEWGLGVTENSNGTVSAIAYPNPATSQQEIELKTTPGEQIEIQLYDLQGRFCGLVYSGIAESDQETISIDLSHLDAGVYVYQLQVRDRTGQLRFVKHD